ncbi:MAG TPA: undecaprenyldiphospho-muramoylpentapeptide beta-N-acetylglucosaminyltransferase [Pseudoalteromonas sp.]|jgi:UDP-N-acetylglucosamine--N-acetylmuramyl-(pentapeptide) pyrophosphoryl-undecaprenol N-acetylglucosamine transferase|uniref:Glycosyltransferase family 28 N-terminal domain-containing protein n=1 Tax=marine sediment metagenome TaxID=412755 RepID=A0A0F9VTH9_9ZZZZ|nr:MULTISPECIES: undecaprenyldiphospho-muramoylpentapeptide beta-N-acetylglucosaminyltransferase [Pseudoalteromonas]TVU72215.1 undecaprenyldiphospho-muramoylpentapeptide beta-N-acetylglucosaminyltransferase [Pseudoalteromonas elyakovii]HDZ33837.1 undecaprenyldiphospho-muramoylpentapeptide beta-N-acetylglucosaminyltransferase [Pseudoalteromonas sp.]|tara:strand:+ start:258 stop:1334 length:1077 start_codon:yes stop_codon:yes gene_type:complete
MSKKLVVVAGGTGGHIFPGIAVADYLKQQGWQVSWIGTPDRMEASVVPKHGIDIDFINVKGVRGNGLKRLIKAPFMVLNAILQARKVLKEQRPDVVLAMGGYVTGPTGIAAKSLGIPLVIHEQNAVAGMSNKWLAKFATRVLAAFPSAFAQGQAELVGNPVRQSVMDIVKRDVSSPINILVVGGSLGAQVLNQTLPEAFKGLSNTAPINVWHQTGKGHLPTVEAAYKAHGLAGGNTKIAEFIDDMDAAYSWADIVVCRAGALTVSEIAAAGKMAVFVPFPHAVDDHQTANAQYLVMANGALLMPQGQFNKQSIIELLSPYLAQPSLITEMATNAKKQAILDATASVATHCEQVTNKRK